MRRGCRSAKGSSIVEVLMVMLIISIVLSMLVPNLLAGRDAARQIQCLNNMRQIALGIQNYDQQHGSLPSGVINPTGPIRHKPEGLHIGWLVELLPFMEQSALFSSIDTRFSIYDPSSGAARGAPISVFRCPTENFGGATIKLGSTSYAGCHHDLEEPIDFDNHGVFFLNSHVTYDDIPDGTGSTIFFGEKLVDQSDLGWASGTRSSLRNTGTPINGKTVVDPDAVKFYGPSVLPVGGFGSRHRGGANFSFGDGSVRFVRESIQMEIFRRLGHRADGEPISADAL